MKPRVWVGPIPKSVGASPLELSPCLRGQSYQSTWFTSPRGQLSIAKTRGSIGIKAQTAVGVAVQPANGNRNCNLSQEPSSRFDGTVVILPRPVKKVVKTNLFAKKKEKNKIVAKKNPRYAIFLFGKMFVKITKI